MAAALSARLRFNQSPDEIGAITGKAYSQNQQKLASNAGQGAAPFLGARVAREMRAWMRRRPG
jgi:hypothetical protein